MRNWQRSVFFSVLVLLLGCREKEDISPTSENTQTSDTTEQGFDCIFITEKMPEFPGGILALATFLRKNLHYPSGSGCVSGKVFVSFTIGADGQVSDAKILKGISPDCDAEALRVVSVMPKWILGESLDGQKKTVQYSLPICFGIETVATEDAESDL